MKPSPVPTSAPASPSSSMSERHAPPRRLRGALLFIALVLAMAVTFLAFRQQPAPYQDGPPADLGSWRWFKLPVERNPWLRIPSAYVPGSAGIVGVSAADNGRYVWVTTTSGLIFRSVDAGESWTLLSTGAGQLSPRRPPVFLDGSRGWLVSGNALWTTRNGGESWETESLPEQALPLALSRTGDSVYCLTQSTVLSWTGRGWAPLKGLDLSGRGSSSALSLSGLMTEQPDASDIFAVAEDSLLLINSRGTTLISTGKASGFIRLPLEVDFSAKDVQSLRVAGDRRQYLVLTDRGVIGINPDDINTWRWTGRITDAVPMPMWWVTDEGLLHDTDVERFLQAKQSSFPRILPNPEGWTGYALVGFLVKPGDHMTPGSVLRSRGGSIWERSLVINEKFHSPAVDPKGRIWVGSSTGLILRSKDRGLSWERMGALPRPVSAIWFSADGTTGYLASDQTYRFDPDVEPAVFTLKTAAPTETSRPKPTLSLVCGYSGCTDASLIQGRRWMLSGERLAGQPESGTDGLRLIEADGTWKQQLPGPINDVLSFGNGVGLAFGGNRSIYRTSNWGRTWELVEHAVYPAPWYYATWLPLLALVLAAVFWRTPPDKEPILGSQLTSDRPIEESSRDVLGLHEIAVGLSRFLRNDQTEPSLTIAVTGPWGAGKSSLLNLLKWDLWQYGLRPISFNAWHNEQQGNPVAAFYEAIVQDGLPPLFSPEGIWFRWRLLLKRGQRHRAKLVTTLLISLFAFTYYQSAPDRFDDSLAVLTGVLSRLAQLLGASSGKSESPEPASDPMSHWFGVLVTLAGLVSVARTLVDRLKAFGVEPAKLMAALQGSTKVADTRESVGFHARFAEDFGEVTRALPYPLVILVEDLERCSPANVLKMLEAINFLVSSGDCFVVMAVHMQILQAHLRPELKTLMPTEGAAEGMPPDLVSNYLEKLINLEVKVPRMTYEHAVRLTSPLLIDADWERRRELLQKSERGRLAVRQARKIMAWSFFAMAASLSIALAWWVRPVPPPAHVQAAQALVAQAPLADASTTPSTPLPTQRQDTAGPQTERAQERKPSVRTPSSTREDAATVQPVPEDTLTLRWLAPVMLGLLMALLLVFSRPSGGVVVTDSKGFQDALREWMPVLLRQYTTPRALKRFLNRLRYTAMLQGNTDEDEEGPLVAFLHGWMESRAEGRPWLARWRDALRSARTGGRRARASVEPSSDLLPDAWLVAFTATVEQDEGRALFDALTRSPELPLEPPIVPVPEAQPGTPAENLQRAAVPAEAPGRSTSRPAGPPAPGASPDEIHSCWVRTQQINAVRDFRKTATLYAALRAKTGEPPPGTPD